MKELCCGGIVYRKGKFLLIRHTKVGGWHWDYPKGHTEGWESEEETAAREIHEETGLRVSIVPGFREMISYTDHIHDVEKTVVFFICKEAIGKVSLQKEEVEDYSWLSYEDALSRLTFCNSKDILRKADAFLRKKGEGYQS